MTNINTSKYDVIGLMSGTSLDGLDIAFCRFIVDKNKWKFTILNAETIDYSFDWISRLKNAENLNALDFQSLHNEYGLYLGGQVADFIKKNSISPDFVSSHGHTIFHQPHNQLTVQIGSGAAIASVCKLDVVNDFRVQDVFLGGQGAPLVPIGDKLLFADYEFCLNLGGFANISYDQGGKRIAFDICPVNIVLNHYAQQTGRKYDDGGALAASGQVHQELLSKLNELDFYAIPAHRPKSLGKEWVVKNVFPLIDSFPIPLNDRMRTFSEHIAVQIEKITENKTGQMFVSGGGVYNETLMKLIQQKSPVKVIIPGKEVVEFKEALIFAFLGVLRMRGEINCLSSVTGATRDSCCGTLTLFR